MLYLKECPRCHGDIYKESDVYGEYKKCLQCGYMVDVDRVNGQLAPAISRAKKKVA